MDAMDKVLKTLVSIA